MCVISALRNYAKEVFSNIQMDTDIYLFSVGTDLQVKINEYNRNNK